MINNFWDQLQKPIFMLAPMANVTDAAFRRMFVECGKLDVFVTEFVSVEGLLSKGRENLLADFLHTEAKYPIIAQVFGAIPEHFSEITTLIHERGFDGIDINMGCPDRDVEKQGAGAGLIKNPELAKKIIRSVKKSAKEMSISVKIRIGYNKKEDYLP